MTRDDIIQEIICIHQQQGAATRRLQVLLRKLEGVSTPSVRKGCLTQQQKNRLLAGLGQKKIK